MEAKTGGLFLIGIIDYGAGNLTSVIGAFRYLGCEAKIVDNAVSLDACTHIVLPGVGAFSDGMNELHKRRLVEPMTEKVLGYSTPFLGICLGAQLMATQGHEGDRCPGLGWIEADVISLRPDDPALALPHVGWNDFHITQRTPLFDGISEAPLFYFVHSYHIRPLNETLITGTCNYGQNFVAALHQGNIHAVQFHPEKSQKDGLRILQNFLTFS